MKGSKARPLAVLATVLLAAGCTSSKLVSDLHSADAPCRDQDFKQKSPLDACLSAHEQPVWAKDEPATLDIYEGYDRARAELARQRDSGTLTEDQYSDKLDQLNSQTAKELGDRRRELAANGAPQPPAAQRSGNAPD